MERRRINIIDTPGHVDFTVEVERALRVLDGAIAIFVGSWSPTTVGNVWRQADRYHVPRIAFVNKWTGLSRFFRVYTMINQDLGTKRWLQLPIGGRGLEGIIDLIQLKALSMMTSWVGGFERPLIPGEMELAVEWRDDLIERLAERDEEILNLYLKRNL